MTETSRGILSRLKEEFSFIRGNYLILVLTWVLMDFVREMPETYYGLYVIELDGSAFIIGVIGFCSQLAMAAVQFPGGYLADKYGRRWLIVSMTFGLALSHLFYAFAPSWHLILVGALVQSLCRVYNPALRALIADSIPQERRGMAYSINSLIMGVSTTPAPLIAGLLFVKFGLVPSMKITYLLVTVFYLLAAFLRIRLKETIESPSRINVRELFGAYPQAIKETLSVWREVPRSMLYLLVSDMFASFGFSLFLPYVVVYAVEDLNIPKFQWSILMTILFVSMLLLALPAGKLVDRFGRKNPILLSSALFPAAMLLLVYGDFTKLVFALPLVGLGQVLAQSAYPSLVTDLTPKNLRGRVMGSSSFFNIIVSAAGNLVGGLLYQNLSHRIIFILPIVLLVPQMLIILFLVHEPEEREV